MRALRAACAAAVAAFAPAAAGAGTIQGNHIGCVSEAYLDEMSMAAARKDVRHGLALMNRVCFYVQGREYSLIERGWLKSKIRVYASGQSFILWVPSEAVRESQK